MKNDRSRKVQAELNVKRLYLKNVSLTSPESPDVFERRWNPELKVDIKAGKKRIVGDEFEVTLTAKIEAFLGHVLALRLDLTQAGLFRVAATEDEALEHVLTVVCTNVLFPYLRESVDNVVVKAGFPPLLLAPVDFEWVMQQAIDHLKSEPIHSPGDDVLN